MKNKILNIFVVLPVYLVTVVSWILFTYGVKLMKKVTKNNKVNYWKYNDVMAIFLNNGEFAHKKQNHSLMIKKGTYEEKGKIYSSSVFILKHGNGETDSYLLKSMDKRD